MRSRSPLAWFLVDRRLRALDPPASCEVVGYYATAGDGPKLPGSDVTIACPWTWEVAMAWARRRMPSLGFHVEDDCDAPGVIASGTAYQLCRAVDDGEVLHIEVTSQEEGSTNIRIGIGFFSG
jgi:hypothetical protein